MFSEDQHVGCQGSLFFLRRTLSAGTTALRVAILQDDDGVGGIAACFKFCAVASANRYARRESDEAHEYPIRFQGLW